MDITNYTSGITANISTETQPKSIPATVVGQAFIDLANLTKTNIESVNAVVTGHTTSINTLSGITSSNFNVLSGITTGNSFNINSLSATTISNANNINSLSGQITGYTSAINSISASTVVAVTGINILSGITIGAPDIKNYNIVLTGLTTTVTNANTFANNEPITEVCKLTTFTALTNVGAVMTIEAYSIVAGTGATFVWTLQHSYGSVTSTATTQTFTISDSFALQPGWFISVRTTGTIYSGTLSGMTWFRKENGLGSGANQAIAYNFSVDRQLTSGGLVSRITTLENNASGSTLDTAIASVNLYDKTTITTGSTIDASGNTAANVNYFLSDYIAVSPGQTYAILKPTFVNYCLFDSSNNVVSGGANISGALSVTIPTTSTIAKARFTINVINGIDQQIKLGAAVTQWSPYGSTTLRKENERKASPFSNTIIQTFGHSIVQMERWQHVVFEKIYATHLNLGVGGTTAINNGTGNYISSAARLATLNNSASLTIIMCGMNDWRGAATIGTLGDNGNTTFYGALYTIANYIFTNNPTGKIIFLTDNYAQKTPPSELNSGGVTIKAYADAVKAFCQFYAIPVADINQNAGINKFNIDTYLDTEVSGEKIHLNYYKGGQIMGNIVYDTILQIGRV